MSTKLTLRLDENVIRNEKRADRVVVSASPRR